MVSLKIYWWRYTKLIAEFLFKYLPSSMSGGDGGLGLNRGKPLSWRVFDCQHAGCWHIGPHDVSSTWTLTAILNCFKNYAEKEIYRCIHVLYLAQLLFMLLCASVINMENVYIIYRTVILCVENRVLFFFIKPSSMKNWVNAPKPQLSLGMYTAPGTLHVTYFFAFNIYVCCILQANCFYILTA